MKIACHKLQIKTELNYILKLKFATDYGTRKDNNTNCS